MHTFTTRFFLIIDHFCSLALRNSHISRGIVNAELPDFSQVQTGDSTQNGAYGILCGDGSNPADAFWTTSAQAPSQGGKPNLAITVSSFHHTLVYGEQADALRTFGQQKGEVRLAFWVGNVVAIAKSCHSCLLQNVRLLVLV